MTETKDDHSRREAVDFLLDTLLNRGIPYAIMPSVLTGIWQSKLTIAIECTQEELWRICGESYR